MEDQREKPASTVPVRENRGQAVLRDMQWTPMDKERKGCLDLDPGPAGAKQTVPYHQMPESSPPSSAVYYIP